MRMWMVPVEKLCDMHLRGSHFEIHKHRHIFVKQHSIKGRIFPIVQIEPSSMKKRHDELTKEMEKRFNKKYDSPYKQPNLNHLPRNQRYAKVDVDANLKELYNKCPECRKRIEKHKN